MATFPNTAKAWPDTSHSWPDTSGTWPNISGIYPSALQSADLYVETLVTAIGALNNFTLVVRIRMDDASSPVPPGFNVTSARIWVQGTIASVYLGTQAASGNAYDAGTLTQVFFGGSAGVSAANTVITESDSVSFLWNKTDNIIISMYTGAVNPVSSRNKSFTNYADLYFLSGGDEASAAVKSAGYSSNLNNIYYIPQITLFGN